MTEWYHVIGKFKIEGEAQKAAEDIKEEVEDIKEYSDGYPIRVRGTFLEIGMFEDSIGGDTAQEIEEGMRKLGATSTDISTEEDLQEEGITAIKARM